MEDSIPFDSDLNKVILINKAGKEEVMPEMSKRMLAEKLIEKIARFK